jgi:hypothetical protein
MTPEVAEWLALHRVHEGGVTKLVGHFFTEGRPVADYLAKVFDGLISAGFVALGQPSPTGQQQVCVTHTGQARYVALCWGSTLARVEVVSGGG